MENTVLFYDYVSYNGTTNSLDTNNMLIMEHINDIRHVIQLGNCRTAPGQAARSLCYLDHRNISGLSFGLVYTAHRAQRSL